MSQATGARILVVDDEPAIVRAVELNLRRHQFQVDSARTGQAALEAYTRRRPDLVLLDLGLPDLDGLDVIRSIRARASTPIVVLSVRGAESVMRVGDLAVDLEHRRVTLAGREVHLTPTEYELLKLFLTHPDKVLTDSLILETVWGATYRQQVHSLRVYVARLRNKIEADPRNPRHCSRSRASATASSPTAPRVEKMLTDWSAALSPY